MSGAGWATLWCLGPAVGQKTNQPCTLIFAGLGMGICDQGQPQPQLCSMRVARLYQETSPPWKCGVGRRQLCTSHLILIAFCCSQPSVTCTCSAAGTVQEGFQGDEPSRKLSGGMQLAAGLCGHATAG